MASSSSSSSPSHRAEAEIQQRLCELQRGVLDLLVQGIMRPKVGRTPREKAVMDMNYPLYRTIAAELYDAARLPRGGSRDYVDLYRWMIAFMGGSDALPSLFDMLITPSFIRRGVSEFPPGLPRLVVTTSGVLMPVQSETSSSSVPEVNVDFDALLEFVGGKIERALVDVSECCVWSVDFELRTQNTDSTGLASGYAPKHAIIAPVSYELISPSYGYVMRGRSLPQRAPSLFTDEVRRLLSQQLQPQSPYRDGVWKDYVKHIKRFVGYDCVLHSASDREQLREFVQIFTNGTDDYASLFYRIWNTNPIRSTMTGREATQYIATAALSGAYGDLPIVFDRLRQVAFDQERGEAYEWASILVSRAFVTASLGNHAPLSEVYGAFSAPERRYLFDEAASRLVSQNEPGALKVMHEYGVDLSRCMCGERTLVEYAGVILVPVDAISIIGQLLSLPGATRPSAAAVSRWPGDTTRWYLENVVWQGGNDNKLSDQPASVRLELERTFAAVPQQR